MAAKYCAFYHKLLSLPYLIHAQFIVEFEVIRLFCGLGSQSFLTPP